MHFKGCQNILINSSRNIINPLGWYMSKKRNDEVRKDNFYSALTQSAKRKLVVVCGLRKRQKEPLGPRKEKEIPLFYASL